MENKHTAGQWKIYDTCLPARGIMEIQVDGKVIANVKRLVTGKCYAASQCPEAEANAKLIAAAPELLQVLQDILNDDKMNGILTASERVNAKNAINKATA